MSRLLVAAATREELNAWGSSAQTGLCLSGVGVPETLVNLSAELNPETVKYVINIGIAGAYPDSGLNLGDIVVATEECYGDIGVEDPEIDGFRPLKDLPFGAAYQRPLPTYSVPGFCFEGFGFSVYRGKGVTVNTCTGTAATGQERAKIFSGRFETMEGAAVAHLGHKRGIPVTEIRAISNIASERDMRPGAVKTALANLNLYLTFFKNTYEKNLFHRDFSLPQ